MLESMDKKSRFGKIELIKIRLGISQWKNSAQLKNSMNNPPTAQRSSQ